MVTSLPKMLACEQNYVYLMGFSVVCIVRHAVRLISRSGETTVTFIIPHFNCIFHCVCALFVYARVVDEM